MNKLIALGIAIALASGLEIPARADTTARPTGFMQLDTLLHFCSNFNNNTEAEKLEADAERNTCVWYIAVIADLLSAGGRACPNLATLAPVDMGAVLLRSITNDLKANRLHWPVPRGIPAAPYVEDMLTAAFSCGPTKHL
jgi:hypothetical protein